MRELQERFRASVNPIVATVAGIVSVAALIVAIAAMARTAEPDALTRAEAEQLIDQAVMRVADPAAYTQAVVARAMSRYDAEGREASIAYHSSQESIDGPWYVFLLDENGFVLANPARPDFVGTTPAVRSNITGKPYGREVVAADEDGRWVDYVFVNPTTGRAGAQAHLGHQARRAVVCLGMVRADLTRGRPGDLHAGVCGPGPEPL